MERTLQSGQDWDFIQVPGRREPVSEAVRVDARKERKGPGVPPQEENMGCQVWVGWEEDQEELGHEPDGKCG